MPLYVLVSKLNKRVAINTTVEWPENKQHCSHKISPYAGNSYVKDTLCDNSFGGTISRKGNYMLSEQDKAWLAAIIEGEGCLMLCYQSRKQLNKSDMATFISMIVTVCNTNPYMIRAVSEMWHKLGLKFHYTINAYNLHGKQNHAITIVCNSTGSCRKLIEMIRPYLKTKQAEVDIMLEYANYREQLIKNRGPDGRYKDYIDRDYVNQLIEKHKLAKAERYNMLHLPRLANSVLDLTKLRSSETLRETSQDDDKVRASQ
jgi:hypothetical protein